MAMQNSILIKGLQHFITILLALGWILLQMPKAHETRKKLEDGLQFLIILPFLTQTLTPMQIDHI